MTSETERQRIARIDGLQKPAVGVAEVGDGVQRDIRRRFAEYDVKGQQIVERGARIADRLCEGIGGLNRKARAVERRIERHVAIGDGARRRVGNDLAVAEILEEIARIGFRARHRCRLRSCMILQETAPAGAEGKSCLARSFSGCRGRTATLFKD